MAGPDRADVEEWAWARLLALNVEGAGDGPPSADAEHELTTWPGLRGLLQAILADEGWTAAVAAGSFEHVLGFDKFILVSHRPLGQVRMHVWWPALSRMREDVHNHRFDFVSHVLLGGIRTRLYGASEDGSPYVRFEESAVPAEQQWRLAEVGRERLAVQLVADLGPGTVYRLGHQALHNVEALPGLVTTLVFELTSTRSSSSVYVPEDAVQPRSGSQGRFSPQGATSRLQRLLELAGGAEP